MPRFILIDEFTGYVWGAVYSDTPEAACRLVDEANSEFDRRYTSIGRAPFSGRSGYHVHVAPDDWPSADGSVAAHNLPLAARVLIDDGAPL